MITAEQPTQAVGERNGLPPDELRQANPVRPWPVLLLALPAFVAIWSGWVGLGELTGFGPVHPLPGIADNVSINTAITLPIGMETYASYALYVWLSGRIRSDRTRSYAKWSAIGSLGLGAVGQVAYHLMQAAGVTAAPWQVTVGVSCLPVVVLGMGAALAHMIVGEHHTTPAAPTAVPPVRHPVSPSTGVAVAQVIPFHSRAMRRRPPRAVKPPTQRSGQPVQQWPRLARQMRPDSATQRQGRRPGRQVRRDPAVVARVIELAADNIPVTEISAQAGVSARTVGRILADHTATTTRHLETAAPVGDRARANLASDTAVRPNNFRLVAGGTDIGNNDEGEQQ